MEKLIASLFLMVCLQLILFMFVRAHTFSLIKRWKRNKKHINRKKKSAFGNCDAVFQLINFISKRFGNKNRSILVRINTYIADETVHKSKLFVFVRAFCKNKHCSRFYAKQNTSIVRFYSFFPKSTTRLANC